MVENNLEPNSPHRLLPDLPLLQGKTIGQKEYRMTVYRKMGQEDSKQMCLSHTLYTLLKQGRRISTKNHYLRDWGFS